MIINAEITTNQTAIMTLTGPIPAKLGPNQLAWLREHMLYNGVRIFEHWENNKVVRVS